MATSNNLSPDVVLHRGLDQFESSEAFKKMSPKEKVASYQHIYKKYAVPALKAKGLNTSMFDWIKERAGKAPTIAEQSSSGEKFMAGVAHGTTAMIKAGNDLYEKYLMNPSHKDKPGMVRSAIKNLVEREKKVGGQYTNPASLKDEAIFLGGNILSQTPAFMATDGILGRFGINEMLEGEALAKAGAVEKFLTHSVKDAAEGYLIGTLTGDDPKQTAVGFATINPIGRAGFKFIGKLLGIGGTKLISETIEKATNRASIEAVETTASPVVVAKVGSPKQKLTAAMVRTLQTALPKDKLWKDASTEEREFAIGVLAKQEPEMAKWLQVENEKLVALKAEADLSKERKASPQLDGILGKLEGLDKTPTSVSVAQHSKEAITNASVKSSPNIAFFKNNGELRTVPGAASASSLEFEKNMSTHVDQALSQLGLGKEKISWEDRGHKLLFFLNVLEAQNAMQGPTRKRDRLLQQLLMHLNDRYPNTSPEMLVGMSDQVWNKLEALSRAGMFEGTDGPVRVWRNTFLGKGISPFTHEVQLFRKAGMAGSPLEIGQRVRVGATHDFGRVIETDSHTTLVELTSGKRVNIGTNKLFHEDTSMIDAARKLADQRDEQGVIDSARRTLEKEQSKSLRENIRISEEKAKARERMDREEAKLTKHGAGGASAEEISRNETFVKIRGDGTLDFHGVSPDPTTRRGLRPDEVIVAINKRTGAMRYQDGNHNTMNRYGDIVKEVISNLRGKKK